MADPTYGFVDEAGTFTKEMLDKVAAVARRQAVLPNGDGTYHLWLTPHAEHELKVMFARENWKKYYRAMRTLRRIRQDDEWRFTQWCRLVDIQ